MGTKARIAAAVRVGESSAVIVGSPAARIIT
jgi:hypothetical protein